MQIRGIKMKRSQKSGRNDAKMCPTRSRVCRLLILVLLFEMVTCQDGVFFTKTSKNAPRIGRRSKNTNDENFEKFFLKASKSVPRIGRRRSEVPLSKQTKEGGTYPLWSELPDLFEYNPELFNAPEILKDYTGDYEMQGDDPGVQDWNRIRLKRTDSSRNKELMMSRLQPNV